MAYATKKKLSDNSIVPLGSNLYGTCSTGNSTATKTVVMPDFNVLVEGVTIHVYFAHENTASNPKLKVGSTDAKSIHYNGQARGSWDAGGFISFTYYSGSWHQNDITVAGVTYTFTINDHTMTISGSDGSVQTITIPDTTYTLSKSGSTVTLTGSDGSTTSVSDSDTKYGLQLQNGKLKLVEGGSTSEITLPDNNTTYTISISGHTITLTPSSGTAQSVTVPDNNTTYTISKSGSTVTLTGSDGSTSTFTDANTTYTAGAGLSLSGTEFSAKTGFTTSGNNRAVQTDTNGNLYVVQKDSNTTYSLTQDASDGHKITLTPSSGTAQTVTIPDDDTKYTAGTGLSLSGTTFNHSNSVTAVTSDSLLKVKYDAQGHITGSSSVAKADITALGIPGSDTNNRRAFYGTCSTAAATAAKAVTLSSTTGWELVAGTIVGVKFTYTNTAQNPTLNVNSTGAKSIWYGQAVLTTGNLNKAGYASRVEYYMYDGTNWVWINWGVDDNSTYTAGTGLSLSGTTFSANLGYTTSGNNRAVLADSDGKLYVTQKDDNTTYTAGTGLSLSGTQFSVKTGYTTSGNNRKVQADSSGNLYVVQKDDNTTYTAGTGLSLSGTEFSVKTGYTTSGNNRKVQADSSGNLYVVQKDSNTTYSAGTGLSLSDTTFNHSNSVTALTTEGLQKIKYDAQGHITGSTAVAKADITGLGIPGSDTNNRRGFYGTCSTAAGTAAKTVTLSSTAGWELVAGTIVGVKFSYTNSAQNPTLNVNSSGAKSIWYNTGVITTGNKAGYANRITYYMYDGSHWVWMGWSIDDNTWQSNTNARAGYVASGANQDTKVWKTDEDGNPAWRDERITVFPAISYTGASTSTTVNIPNGTITQVPLTREVFHLVGNVGSSLDYNADDHSVAIEGDTGYYRITASVYIAPTAAAMVGVYIMQGDGYFAGATEIASSFSYATSGGAVNVTKTIKIVGPASRENIYLGARVMGTTGKAYTGNVATYLEIEQIG